MSRSPEDVLTVRRAPTGLAAREQLSRGHTCTHAPGGTGFPPPRAPSGSVRLIRTSRTSGAQTDARSWPVAGCQCLLWSRNRLGCPLSSRPPSLRVSALNRHSRAPLRQLPVPSRGLSRPLLLAVQGESVPELELQLWCLWTKLLAPATEDQSVAEAVAPHLGHILVSPRMLVLPRWRHF